MKVNTSRLRGKLDAARRDLTTAVTRARIEVAEDLLSKAVAITPIEEGTLRASGTVDHTEDTSTVSFGGGQASEYALVQHEDLSLKHEPPGQAKYLEEPAVQGWPRWSKYIIDAGKRGLRG